MNLEELEKMTSDHPEFSKLKRYLNASITKGEIIEALEHLEDDDIVLIGNHEHDYWKSKTASNIISSGSAILSWSEMHRKPSIEFYEAGSDEIENSSYSKSELKIPVTILSISNEYL
jgi:hypothetical protein